MLDRMFRVLKVPVTLLALLALLAFGFKWGYENVTAPPPPDEIDPCVPTQIIDGKLRADQVTVRVYNASSKRGLAGEVTRSLTDRGFLVDRTGNYPGADAVQGTVVVGTTPDAPEVKLVQGFFKDAQVIGDNRPEHSVEVRIGEGYPGLDDAAPGEIEVPGDTICLPAKPDPGTEG